MSDDQAFKVYTTRWKCLPAAVVGALFLFVGIATLLRGRDTGLSLLVAVGCGTMGAVTALYGWYFVLTPVPVLRVDASGMAYQHFPLKMQRVRWEDVGKIAAIKSRMFIAGSRRREQELTVFITFAPRPGARYGGPRLIWRFYGADLPVSADEVVRQIRRFHAVEYDDQLDRPWWQGSR